MKEQRPNLTTHKIKLFTGANLGTKKVKRDFTKKQFKAKYVYLTLLVAFFARTALFSVFFSPSRERRLKFSHTISCRAEIKLVVRIQLTSADWWNQLSRNILSKNESDNFTEKNKYIKLHGRKNLIKF